MTETKSPLANPRPNRAPLADSVERGRIAHDLDTTLIVEAAAGTGKTTALVQRILSLLRSGRATLLDLVAVTFTEKAAGEMKLRLRTEIESARRGETEVTERERLDRALEQLEAARIGTIHAFCADLLRERPVEARVDPLFELSAEEASDRVYDAAFTQWFQSALARAEGPGEGVARVLRRATPDRGESPRQTLHKAGHTLIQNRDFSTPYERLHFDRVAALSRIVERLRPLGELASKGFFKASLTRSLSEIARVLREIDRVAEDYDAIEALLRGLHRHRSWTFKGSGEFYARPLKRADVLAQREEAKVALDAALDDADADLAACLFVELQGVVRAYEEAKALTGRLDFLDLLLVTRDLLASHDDMRAELQRRFTHLLIDEFQDTDPLQAEILLLLAAIDPDERDPARVQVTPGKLFLVGDPKQSIYRFRRADVSFYQAIKTRLVAAGAECLYLRTSFRSAPDLQELVNATFSAQMHSNAQGSQADYVALAPFRANPVGRPSVIALPVPRPYGDYGSIVNFKIDDSLPDAVGALVAWLLNDSGWSVTERGSEQQMPLASRHICLLFKRLHSFGKDVTRPYLRALEVRRIPHVLVGGRGFHDREEIMALRTALAAIEWPDDPLSVYGALHGPFFALADDALLAFKYTQGHFHPLRPLDEARLTELTRPVADALSVLAELHGRRNSHPAADTIAKFLETTRAHAGVAIWPAGEQALANLFRVLDMARRSESRHTTSFRAFVEALDDEADRGGAGEAPIVEEGTDGVRAMSVHKAKGLEFPVVILCDPTAPVTFREPTRYVDAERKLWAVPLCGASPRELLAHREEILAQDSDEALRLLYVATTRARELLVVPVLGDERRDAPQGWLDALHDALYPRDRRESDAAEGCPAFGEDTVLDRPARAEARPEDAVRPGAHVPKVGAHRVVWWDPSALDLGRTEDAGLRQARILQADDRGTTAQDGVERHARWKAVRAETLALAAIPSRSIEVITEGNGSDDAVPTVSFAMTSASRGTRPGGARFGSLVHSILATIPLDASEAAVARAAHTHGRLLSATEAEIEAADGAVRAALAHPVLVSARASSRLYREAVVMMAQAGGVVIEGVVDLAFLEGDFYTVVDFKTDADLSHAKNAYARQVWTYAQAIARATQRPVRAMILSV